MSKERYSVGYFFAGLFSEPGTECKPSFSRVLSALALLAGIVWVTRIVWTTGELPDLAGLALFVGALYGLNQARSVLSSHKVGSNG